MSLAGRLNGRLTRLAAGRHLPRRTVRVRLTLLYGALFLVSGAALVAVTYGLFQRATDYPRPQLPQIPHAPAIRNLRHPARLTQALPPLAHALPQLRQIQRDFVQDQHRLAGAMSGPGPFRRPPAALLPRRLVTDQRRLARDQHRLTQAVNQLELAVHQITRTSSVQAAQRAADSHQLLVSSGIALGIVAVLALLGGWLLAGRMLRPIRTITRTAQRISSASLKERLALDGPHDELKELGDTLDDLFARLDAAFEAQRQFVANASHELRAPLTRQRALIQVALADPDASLDSLRRAHERALASEHDLEQMIDGLMALTRGRAGLERREHVDLARLAADTLLAREPQLTRLDLDVRPALAAAPTTGDPRLLERLIANLVDNAIRHNAPGGQLVLATGMREGRAFVSIANTGAAIPPGELERLFQPFQRLSVRTHHDSGHGLGLSIVQAIATAHGAELSARAQPRGGLAIEISLPPSPGVSGELAVAQRTSSATSTVADFSPW
jgi:signal transduction histidine kinase